MRVMRNIRLPLAMLPMLAGLAGCGYRAGFLIPADIRSINVQTASNQTFWRQAIKTDNRHLSRPLATPRPSRPMTADLTEQVKNEIVRRTHLKLAPAEKADSLLNTTITSVKLVSVGRDGADNVTSGTVEIAIAFKWTDRRTGRLIAARTGITRSVTYQTLQQENFTTAARQSFEYIAERIIEGMQEDF